MKRNTKLFKTNVYNNPCLKELWKEWEAPIKMFESLFREYYILNHANFAHRMIKCKEDIIECID